ncbi:GGDEF domain-containing protein [Agaribacter flavus]|uniref:diguanylate cyclase n=1 Tax=Agaribacter flavus TaxID=1902781 RepID=A0ABV7FSQ5_9ALTE
MKESIARLTQIEVIDLLYKQSWRVAIAHPISGLILATWLMPVADSHTLFTWLSTVVLLSVLRLTLFFIYTKKRDAIQSEQFKYWKYTWMAFSVVVGLLYALAFIYFVPMDKPEYVMSIGLFVVILSAVACIGFGASYLSTLSFYVPITVPSSVHLLVSGGQAGLIAFLSILFFSGIVLSLLRNVNAAFKKSISLNFQYGHEIEKRKIVEHQLQEISRRDGLTGLFNRRYFDEILTTEIGRAFRNHSNLSLILLDVDHFKEYNDHYGHVAGDNCLIEIAQHLSHLAQRKGDLIARYGGEEFAIILPNIDAQGAFSFAEKLQLYIQEKRIPHVTSKLTYLRSITISLGVTTLPPLSKLSAEKLITRADKALYEAKRQGRNRVKYYESLNFDQDTA